jgi:hypothetical protein
MRTVPYPLTEEAVQLIQMTFADHVRAERSATRSWGRIVAHGSRLGAHNPTEVSRNACLLRMVSIVEAYADLMSSEMFEAGTPNANDLVRQLVADVELRSSSTWDRRATAFKDFHQVRLPSIERWRELQAAVQARNAVAHGLGNLTPRQRTGSTARTLTRIKVDVRDQRIQVSEAALVRVRDDLVRFLRDLDRAIQSR